VSAIEHKSIFRKNVALHRGAPASRVLGIAVSAGGLDPLIDVLSELPAAFLAAIVIVQHVGPVSRLPNLLRSRVALRVKFAEPDEPLCRGVIYVTPPNRHVIVNPHRTFSLSDAPRLRFQRPSADWLFRSAAASYGRRSIAVVLSGRLDDGARGLRCVHRAGGYCIAQAPESCVHPAMPTAAIQTGCVHTVLKPSEIGPAILAKVGGDVRHSSARPAPSRFMAT